MVLGGALVNRIYYHFYDLGVRNISKQDNVLHLSALDFTFNIKGNNLEVLIEPLGDVDHSKFLKHLESIHDKDFARNFPVIKEKIKRYSPHLKGKQFVYNDGEYSFKAEFVSNNEIKALQSVLYCVVKPVVLFNTRKR